MAILRYNHTIKTIYRFFHYSFLVLLQTFFLKAWLTVHRIAATRLREMEYVDKRFCSFFKGTQIKCFQKQLFKCQTGMQFF